MQGLCITGSSDHLLRVWPLDFSDYFLEAEHESAISSVAVSTDGLRAGVSIYIVHTCGTTFLSILSMPSCFLQVLTIDGSIGMLDLSNQQYRTIMRSHKTQTNCVTSSSIRHELGSGSTDGTVRIWSLDNWQQQSQWDCAGDSCTSISFHPQGSYLRTKAKSSMCLRLKVCNDY